jgi:hypothetical protein
MGISVKRAASWSFPEIALILCLPMAGSAGFFGRSGDGARGPTVLTLEPGARSTALGEAVVASTGGAAEVFANPATLRNVGRPELFVSRTAFGADQSLTAASYVRPRWRGARHAWGASFALLQTDPFDVVVEDSSSGEVRPWEGVVAVSHARPLGFVAAGASVKLIHQDLGGDAATTVAMDMGFSQDIREGRVGWGVALVNAGPSLNWGERHTGLPTALKLGVERRFRRGETSAQWDWPAGRKPILRAGGSWRAAIWKGRVLALRAGWAGDERVGSDRWIPSLGWGLDMGAGQINYALTARTGGAAVHRVDVGCRWGRALPEESARAASIRRARDAMATGQWLAARQTVRECMGTSPRDPELRRLSADIERGFTESLDPDALLARGREAFVAGRYEEAAEAYRALLIVDPKNKSATDGLARAEGRRAAVEEARARSRVHEARRREIALWTESARTAMSAQRWREAHDLWRKVVAADPTRRDAAQARDLCAAEARGRAQSAYAAGMSAYGAGRLEEAVTLFRRAHEDDPDDKNILRSLERVEEEWRRR